jgi:hypothetical protein
MATQGSDAGFLTVSDSAPGIPLIHVRDFPVVQVSLFLRSNFYRHPPVGVRRAGAAGKSR